MRLEPPLSRIRSSLTYANVVSTLCLFIVLGGGAYAAKSALIDGATLKPHSVSGRKLKTDTLTGKQIKESKLGQVPDAAKLAGKPASAYQPAGSYLAANGTAANAAALGGKAPSAFVDASRVFNGSGDTGSAPAQTIMTYAPLGITVRTDGDADGDKTLAIVNNGPTQVEVSQPETTTIHVMSAGQTFTTNVLTAGSVGTWVLRPTGTGDPKKSFMFTCGFDFAPNVANCVGFGIG